MAGKPGDPRGTARWKRMRAEVLAMATHCAICGRPLVPHLKSPHPLSSTLDHVTPLALGGDPYGPVRAAHFGCNASLGASLGNRLRDTRKRRPSRSW